MMNILRIFLGAFFLLIPMQLYAAERQYAEENVEGNYLGGSKSGDLNGQKVFPAEIPLEELRAPEKGALDEQGKQFDEKGKISLREVAEKGKILLQAETGDSYVVLKWRVVGVRQLQGESPLKYTIFFGAESGKYDKKLDVGNAMEHKLNRLVNHQVYFIKVQGYTKDNTIVLFSEELQVIPLPEEELGSPLERSFSRKLVTLQDRKDKIEADSFKRELKQFGYDFFKNSLGNGLPAENVPVGNDYTVGPGDSIRIDLWGSVSARHELEVDRNGEIAIPKVGVLRVWGLSYGQVKEAINKSIARYFKGYELNVSLGRLRTIQVFVVGEVEAPGTYQISSMGTVINVLSLAGGPSKNGSLRSVKLLKGDKVIQDIDLYDMFLSGDRSKDIRLESGDTIFVPVIGPVVAVAGEVKRPAIYELKGKTTLPQLLAMAGGVTAAGYTGRLQLERFEENSAKIIIDYEPKSATLEEPLADVEVRDRDMVKVFPVNRAMRQVVTLGGYVARPGEYQFKKGMRLTDLIADYDALLPDAWLNSAEITRLALPDYHREMLTINLKKALSGDETENILLQEQDTIQVFSNGEKEEKRTVAITGQVVKPGIFAYYPNMTVRDLVALAGSVKWNAFLDSAELTRLKVEEGRATLTRTSIDLGKSLVGDPLNNRVLLPNDTLIVRSVVDWLEAKDRFVVLTGEVRYPGTYSIAKGERLSSVIERAGGFTDKAYLQGAKFTRVSVQENQQKRMDEIIAKSEQDILRKQAELASLAASREELEATKASLDGLMQGLQKLKESKAEGRVVLYLTALENFRSAPYDVELMGGDTLHIPMTPNVVNVMGYVYNSTTLIHMPGNSLSYYLKKAGGPTRDAEEAELYVIKADGTVVSREQSSWFFGGFMSAALDPGDTLVVPQKLERTAWLREIKDITTIMSQIALTAGTVLIGLR